LPLKEKKIITAKSFSALQKNVDENDLGQIILDRAPQTFPK
jgi:hypothetical protein